MWEKILNILFPKRCVGCQKENTWFCKNCISKVNFSKVPFIRNLNAELDGLVYVAQFKEPLKEAIHAFKYDGIRELVYPLCGLIIKHLEENHLSFIKNFILIPVPLHKSRELERGFNQADLIAEEIAKRLNLKVLKGALVKTKKTQLQVSLKGRERKKNIKGAFVIKDKKEIKNKKILLVDDVVTTGSTLNEAARVLKNAGAERVWGLALAKD